MSGSFNKGEIRLDGNAVGVYYSGQVISGSIMFDLDQPITFSVIYIQFLGEANVMWTESEIQTVNGVENHKLMKYAGREEYFNVTQQIAGGMGTSQLPAGRQSFPFNFQIPFTAPSSFKGEQGQVTYSMNAHLVYAEPSILNEVLTKNFQIVAPFDLNLGSPRIKQPIDLEFEEVYGCLCGSDPVTIRVRLPISGYCPGQTIPVGVQVDNKSSTEITKMRLEILSKELYRSQQPASEYIMPETVLTTLKKGPILPNCKYNGTFNLVVPEILPPFLENCSIIDVGYFFRITIKLSGCNDELQDEAELCLGLVPVREYMEGEYVHPLAHCLPPGPIPDPSQTPQLLVPPVTAGFTGSNTSLQRIPYNPSQAAPYPNNPPPYPSGNGSYPTENRFQTPVSMEMKPRPFQDFPIGFNAPESGPGNMPYPSHASSGNTPYPRNVPTSMPYPSNAPSGNTPYPRNVPTGMPYPSNAPSGMNPPPYMSVAQPPYPTDNMMPRVTSGGPPYAQGGYGPSAPPPN